MVVTKRPTRRTTPDTLEEYREKRDFSRTSEPAGRSGHADDAASLRFVVQKHAASHLHFDFRLELDGVMKSWAVPKGPSLDPSIKRLAMQVEDHPIEYNTFEGTIPKGEYGGGTVMLWDRGRYGADRGAGARTADDRSDQQILRDGYERGDLKFVLYGARLRGSWVLVRTRLRSGKASGRPQWLLIKHRDVEARPGSDIVAESETSVASDRTMAEITAAGDETAAEPADVEAPQRAAPRARKAKSSERSAGRRSAARRPTGKGRARKPSRGRA